MVTLGEREHWRMMIIMQIWCIKIKRGQCLHCGKRGCVYMYVRRTWTMRRCCILTPRTEDKRSRMSSSSSNKFTNRSTAHTVCLSCFVAASRCLLVVPCHRLGTYGRRDFALAGPTVWNSIPDNLRDPDVTIDNPKRLLKTFLFSSYQCN